MVEISGAVCNTYSRMDGQKHYGSLGHSHLIFRFVFPPIAYKQAPAKFKIVVSILFFSCPQTLEISQELLVFYSTSTRHSTSTIAHFKISKHYQNSQILRVVFPASCMLQPSYYNLSSVCGSACPLTTMPFTDLQAPNSATYSIEMYRGYGDNFIIL